MKINKKDVGNRIKELRNQKNISMSTLAKEIKVASKSTVNSWERGQSVPKQSTLTKLASFFNVDINFLKYGTLKKYVISLLKEDLNSQDSILYATVEDFLNFFTKEDVASKNFPLSELINAENVEEDFFKIIHDNTVNTFIEIFSTNLYSDFEKYSGNQLHYENDSVLLGQLFDFISMKSVKYSETFLGKCNSIQKSIKSNIPASEGFSDMSIENIEKIIRKVPNTHTAIDLKYSSKLHDLEMDFLKKLDDLENEYSKLKNDSENKN